MGQVKLSGSLRAGPGGNGGFPSMVATAGLSTKEDPKGYQRATGILRRNETYGAFTDLGEPGNVVTQAHFLYFKSDSPVELRLTQDDGAGGNVISVVHVDGLFIQEFDVATLAGKYLKALELNTLGQEVVFEYFLSGSQ